MRIGRLAILSLILTGSAPATPTEAVPTDWVTIPAGAAFTLRAPPGTKFHRLQGIDSFVGEFVHPAFTIGFDYGFYSNDLTDLRANPRYKGETASVDGRSAVIVSGPGEGDQSWGCSGHLVAVYVEKASTHRPNKLEMHGCTADPATVATLTAILKTVRFPR